MVNANVYSKKYQKIIFEVEISAFVYISTSFTYKLFWGEISFNNFFLVKMSIYL